MKRSMRLSEFLAEIGRAGGIAAHAASQYSEERLLGHCTFHKDQKSYKPDTIGIIIDGKVIPVPRYVLSRAGGLDLGQLKVEFEATVDLDSVARAYDPKAETNSPDTKIGVRFKRGLFKNDTHVKVEADGMAKDAAAERFFRVSERENIDLHTEVSLVESDKPFTIGASIPPVMVTKTGPIEISEAKLSLGMNVSSMNESSSVTDKKMEGEGRASWGIGAFKVSFGMRSSIAVKLERRRRLDYSAHCDVGVTMTQSPPPEGQMVILDAFADCMRRTMDLNMSLVERQLRDASETADPPPALKMDNEPGRGISQWPTPGA